MCSVSINYDTEVDKAINFLFYALGDNIMLLVMGKDLM